MEHAKFEQIDFGATVHASFDELEAIHIPFERTITPRQRQPCKDGIFVLLHPSHKGRKRFKMTGLHRCQPGVKLFSCVLAHHMQKRFHQLVSSLNVWVSLPQQLKARQFFFRYQQISIAFARPGNAAQQDRTNVRQLEGRQETRRS